MTLTYAVPVRASIRSLVLQRQLVHARRRWCSRSRSRSRATTPMPGPLAHALPGVERVVEAQAVLEDAEHHQEQDRHDEGELDRRGASRADR